jgi:hypothetical protein
MHFYRAIIVAAIAAAASFAADVDGKWAGKINTPRGDVPMSFDLKADGETVTGTAVGHQGEVPIHAGRFVDGKLSLQLRYNVAGQTLVFTYEGIPNQDEMQMRLLFGVNEPVHFSVKRQTAAATSTKN